MVREYLIQQQILEEFINREGTDYGAVEMSLTDKRHKLQAQVASGDVVILFDFVTSSCTLMRRDEAQHWLQAADGTLP